MRRLPWMLLLQPLLGGLETRREALFAGWFGPIGVAALYYAMVALKHTGHQEVWPLVSLVIAGSLLVHGVTALPFTRAYGRARGAGSRGRPGGS